MCVFVSLLGIQQQGHSGVPKLLQPTIYQPWVTREVVLQDIQFLECGNLTGSSLSVCMKRGIIHNGLRCYVKGIGLMQKGSFLYTCQSHAVREDQSTPEWTTEPPHGVIFNNTRSHFLSACPHGFSKNLTIQYYEQDMTGLLRILSQWNIRATPPVLPLSHCGASKYNRKSGISGFQSDNHCVFSHIMPCVFVLVLVPSPPRPVVGLLPDFHDIHLSC